MSESEQRVYEEIKRLFLKKQAYSRDNFYEICKRTLPDLPDFEIRTALKNLETKKFILNGMWLTRDEVLKNKMRKTIYDFITEFPGYHSSHMVSKFGVGQKTVNGHLDKLEDFNFIKCKIIGNKKVYFNRAFPESDMNTVISLRNETAWKIYSGLISQPEITAETMQEEFNLPRKMLQYHLNKLLQIGLIEKKKGEKSNGAVIYKNAPQAFLSFDGKPPENEALKVVLDVGTQEWQKNNENWKSIGAVLGELGRYEEALKSFEGALRLNHEDARAWYGKALALGLQGDLEQGLKCFAKALQFAPEDVASWKWKGIFLWVLERHEEALVCYEVALGFDANDASLWRVKGGALGDLQRHEEAINCYEEVIKLNPEDHVSWYNKGIALVELGRYKEATTCYNKAIKLSSEEIVYWVEKSFLQFAMKDFDAALASANEAIGLSQDYADGWGALALAHFGKKDFQHFQEALEKAEELGLDSNRTIRFLTDDFLRYCSWIYQNSHPDPSISMEVIECPTDVLQDLKQRVFDYFDSLFHTMSCTKHYS